MGAIGDVARRFEGVRDAFERNLAAGYVMNQLAVGVTSDKRSYRLMRACYDALDRV